MDTESTKALLRRWYDEMWFPRNADLVPELAGPVYTRHEFGASRQVAAEEYQTQVRALQASHDFSDMRYRLIGEDDHVVAIGAWVANGKQWSWVQAFRAEHGKLVETWLSGLHTESSWGEDVIRTL
jgi:hypothetical protein